MLKTTSSLKSNTLSDSSDFESIVRHTAQSNTNLSTKKPNLLIPSLDNNSDSGLDSDTEISSPTRLSSNKLPLVRKRSQKVSSLPSEGTTSNVKPNILSDSSDLESIFNKTVQLHQNLSTKRSKPRTKRSKRCRSSLNNNLGTNLGSDSDSSDFEFIFDEAAHLHQNLSATRSKPRIPHYNHSASKLPPKTKFLKTVNPSKPMESNSTEKEELLNPSQFSSPALTIESIPHVTFLDGPGPLEHDLNSISSAPTLSSTSTGSGQNISLSGNNSDSSASQSTALPNSIASSKIAADSSELLKQNLNSGFSESNSVRPIDPPLPQDSTQLVIEPESEQNVENLVPEPFSILTLGIGVRSFIKNKRS